jgi:hypothetical protein
VKVDFSAPILNMQGNEPLEFRDGKLTLGDCAIEALIGTLVEANGQPEQLAGMDKNRNALLAMKIAEAKEPIEISIEDAGLLKERIGRFWNPLPVARAWALLEDK